MRLRQLDLLRAVAVLLVLGRHMTPPALEVPAPLRVIGWTWYNCGWMGVDLFFVLSGFLVSGLFFTEFQRHGDVRVGRFLVRRGFKIYPPFYLLLLLGTLYLRPSGPVVWQFAMFLRNEVLFLQNYWGGVYPHTWSLAVEEHFYLLLAALVALLTRVRGRSADPFRPLVYIVPLAGAVALGLRTLAALRDPLDVMTTIVPFRTHLRADSLLWGVLLSYWYHCRDRGWLRTLRRYAPLVLLVAALLLAPAFVWIVGRSKALLTIGYSSIALGFAALLALALPPGDAAPREASRWGGLLARVGADSYSIYLWHLPIALWMIPPLEAAGLFAFASPTLVYTTRFTTFLVTSVVVGITMARLIERPSLALRDRLFPSRSGALTTGV